MLRLGLFHGIFHALHHLANLGGLFGCSLEGVLREDRCQADPKRALLAPGMPWKRVESLDFSVDDHLVVVPASHQASDLQKALSGAI